MVFIGPRVFSWLLLLDGLAVGVGLLVGVFGWADLSVLAMLVLPPMALLAGVRLTQHPPDLRDLLILGIAILMVLVSRWSYVGLPETLEGLTNQEWIRALGFAAMASSVIRLNTAQQRWWFWGVCLGLTLYAGGTLIGTLLVGGGYGHVFDVHLANWGGRSNHPPAAYATLAIIALLKGTLPRRLQPALLTGAFSMAVGYVVICGSRTTLLLTGLFALAILGDLNLIEKFKLNYGRRVFLLPLIFSGVSIALLQPLKDSLVIKRMPSLLTDPKARPGLYKEGYQRLLHAFASGNDQILKDLPSQIPEPYWHSLPLDSFRAGGFWVIPIVFTWFATLLLPSWQLLRKTPRTSFSLAATGLITIGLLMTEPSMNVSHYDLLVPQLLTVYMLTMQKLNAAL